MKRFKGIVAALVLAVSVLTCAVAPVVNVSAVAGDKVTACDPEDGWPAKTVCKVECGAGSSNKTAPSLGQCNVKHNEVDAKGQEKDAMYYINIVINVVLGVVGLIAVVMIILGGIWMIISNGDPGKVTKGRQTIIWGIVGLIISLLAFAIVNFVLGNVFGESSPKAVDIVVEVENK